MDNDTVSKERRQFIKGVSATAASLGIAGCSGTDGGGTNDGGTDGGGSGESASQITSIPDDLSSYSIEFWDVHNIQSSTSENLLTTQVEEFREETGAEVKPTWGELSDATGSKWINNISSGLAPHHMQTPSPTHGSFIASEFIRPHDDVMDRYDDEVLSNTEQSREDFQSAYSGYPANLYAMPISDMITSPYVIRRDHANQAGVDPEKDFPPQGMDHLVQLARQLEEEGPGKGFGSYGGPGDIHDEGPLCWSVARGGVNGRYLNEDWSDTMWDSEAWKWTIRNWSAFNLEYNVAPKGSGSHSDEQAMQFLLSGDTSLTNVNPQAHGIVRARSPELIDEGTILYGPHWEGQAGNRGTHRYFGWMLPKAPSDADKNEWHRNQVASQAWIQRFLQPELQERWASTVGHAPVRSDVPPEDIKANNKHQLGTALSAMQQNIGPAISSYSNLNLVKAQIPGPILQRAYLGDISAEEACNQVAEEVRTQDPNLGG